MACNYYQRSSHNKGQTGTWRGNNRSGTHALQRPSHTWEHLLVCTHMWPRLIHVRAWTVRQRPEAIPPLSHEEGWTKRSLSGSACLRNHTNLCRGGKLQEGTSPSMCRSPTPSYPSQTYQRDRPQTAGFDEKFLKQ